MSIISTDYIIPQYSDKIELSGVTCLDPVNTFDPVNLSTLQDYASFPSSTTLSLAIIFACASQSNVPIATMNSTLQIIGNVVTLSWESFMFTKSGTYLMDATGRDPFQGYGPLGTNINSLISYSLTGSTDIQSAQILANTDECFINEVSDGDITINSNSMSWKLGAF